MYFLVSHEILYIIVTFIVRDTYKKSLE